jgi:hypothetical protein
VYPTGWRDPTPSELQVVVAKLSSDGVAFLPIDIGVEQGFWPMAAECLASWPEAAAFTGHLRHEGPEDARHFTLNYGHAPTIAFLTDRIVHRASVFRRDVLILLSQKAAAGSICDSDSLRGFILAGEALWVNEVWTEAVSGFRDMWRALQA